MQSTEKKKKKKKGLARGKSKQKGFGVQGETGLGLNLTSFCSGGKGQAGAVFRKAGSRGLTRCRRVVACSRIDDCGGGGLQGFLSGAPGVYKESERGRESRCDAKKNAPREGNPSVRRGSSKDP